ncbi:ATP synthase subunit delta [bacterium HR15]|nr:ATP synthase subunit delta [bacterium HR15]
MQKDIRVARRYAGALFRAALNANALHRVGEDLQRLRVILQEIDALRTFLYSPLIPRDRKKQRIEELFARDLQPITLRLLELIIEKRREPLLEAICEEFEQLREAHEGIMHATVYSAVPLTDDEQQQLLQRLENSTGKQVIATFEVDPSLIGGVRVRLGDYQIDGTIRGTLERLHDHVRLEITRRIRH